MKVAGDFHWYFFHCVKSVRNQSFTGPYFPAFALNTGKCGPEKLRIRRLFTLGLSWIENTQVVNIYVSKYLLILKFTINFKLPRDFSVFSSWIVRSVCTLHQSSVKMRERLVKTMSVRSKCFIFYDKIHNKGRLITWNYLI